MRGLQIKINGVWLVLSEDFSLDFQQTSYIFNKQGIFSYPFEIPLEPNRSLVHNIADPFGRIHLAELDYAEAEIWFDGIMLYKGKVRTDDEVDMKETLPFTFLSGGSDFESRIEGLNAQKVPLDREIKLGYMVDEATTSWEQIDDTARPRPGGFKYTWKVIMPDNIMMNYTEYNVSEPYPGKPYCNVRVCASDERHRLKVLEAKRPYSGTCMYVRYFIDCLFKYLKIALDSTALDKYEDFNRLAFFTTQCHADKKGEPFNVPLSTIRKNDFCGEDFTMTQECSVHNGAAKIQKKAEDFTYSARYVYANNKNFPDVEVSALMKDLRSAFGICTVFNSETGRMKFVMINELFRSQEVITLKTPILDCALTQSRIRKIRVTYGEKDDTAFNYSDYSDKVECVNYEDVLNHGAMEAGPPPTGPHRREGQGFSPFDTNCYIDKLTGNAYRVKVNKDTGFEPSLFEVGSYGDYVIGNKGEEDEEQIEIKFSPVVMNNVTTYVKKEDKTGSDKSQALAVFADVELLSGEYYKGEVPCPFLTKFGAEHENDRDLTLQYPQFNALCPESYKMDSESEPPLRNYDAGYTLGIMRGPGNEAKIEYTRPNYDGEGNSSFVFVESTYAFTADSCNNYGMFYDYNGLEPGGADQEGRFSLKLSAKKMDGDTPLPIDTAYENRGLVSKFLSEYLYFMAHKKTVTLLVDMTVSQIINIDFSRRYRIGDYCGFINRINYTLGVDGARNVEMELYTL